VLLVLTVVLLVAGLVLLIVGYLDNAIGDVYASMACAVVAGVALVVLNRWSRQRDERAAAELAATLGAPSVAEAPPPSGSARQPPPSGSARRPEPSVAEAPAPPEPPLPISDYERLRVVDILPLLDGLSREQLIAVRDREAAGKARRTLLRRIASRLGEDPAEVGRRQTPTGGDTPDDPDRRSP
jgi:hypothetical protein